MSETPIDWGCPDWRDAKAYPACADSLKDWEWRWQFMRRWPVYRNLYFSLPRRPTIDPNLEFDPDDRTRGVGRAELSGYNAEHIWHLTNMQVMWNPILEQLHKNPFQRNKGGSLYRLPSREYWEENYVIAGLEGMERLERIEQRFQALLYYLEDEGLLENAPSPFAYVRIDLTRPLPQQMNSAKTKLGKIAGKRRAPRLGGKDRELWPVYLRVIDAKDQGARDMEIFHQILKDAESFDVDLYDRMEKVRNEAVLIADWIEAANQRMETVSAFL